MSIRILFVCTLEAGWGGSELLWTETARILANRGIQVHATLNYRNPVPTAICKLRESGVTFFFHNQPPPLPPPANLLRRGSRWLLRAMKSRSRPIDHRKFIENINPNLVVISQASSVEGYEWMMACKTLGTPYSTISQACHDQLFGNDKDAEYLEPALMGACKSYFVSEENKKRMEHFLGRRYNNAEIVRNPFQTPYETLFTWPSGKTQLRLANVARLHVPSKGQDVLLELLAQPKWRERSILLSIYGTGSNERGLKRLAEMLELSNVTFHGYVSNVSDVWRENHALILPSRYEGLPIALVEAMLCGRPAVVTNVSGNKEVMIDRKTGFLSAAPTIEALDEAMEDLWTHKEILHELGKSAYEHIRKLVPPDPASVFADALLSSVKSS